MTILNKIIAYKRNEVAERKNQVSTRQLELSELFELPRRSFVGELNQSDKVGVIAEFKRRSPSKGVINADAHVEEVAQGYEKAGASALSVLTDAAFFGGSNQDLARAAAVVSIPVLRKDFVVDEFQIVQARAFGAAAILLIAAALGKAEIKRLAAFAQSLGLQVLLEIHAENEIPDDLDNIAAIGVNNRNLHDFTVDVERSFEIAAKLPSELTKISESGLHAAATILELKQAGFRGFLIGETFMKTADPARACANLIEEISSFKL